MNNISECANRIQIFLNLAYLSQAKGYIDLNKQQGKKFTELNQAEKAVCQLFYLYTIKKNEIQNCVDFVM